MGALKTVYWEISGGGHIDVPYGELEGMGDDEIREYFYEGARMEVF